MDRRFFLRLASATPAVVAPATPRIPEYRSVTSYKPVGKGMPGLWPGRLSSIHNSKAIDTETERIDQALVKEMMALGMLALTGDRDTRTAWSRFVSPDDVVGIKINASGAPGICSSPEVVGEIGANLVAVGVKPTNIWVHERFGNQVRTVPYAKFLPEGAHVVTADTYGYDPRTYVEVSFFGEDDTRSNMQRLVTEKLTKIINVPNMKDHGAAGVTGCLKNIAYGEFSNVARSHQYSDTHTLSFIGTLASMEPLRSRTVLHVMDGLKGVWHAGPFSPNKKFRFYPARMMFGTDPVAIDRILIDIIEEKRKAENAPSVWDRSTKLLENAKNFMSDANSNRFIREPGHIEYAGKMGLGVYDKSKIDIREVKS